MILIMITSIIMIIMIILIISIILMIILKILAVKNNQVLNKCFSFQLRRPGNFFIIFHIEGNLFID